VIFFSVTLTDCPQVQAAFDYDAQQPDELSLERGDVVKVFRKMPDGKYTAEPLHNTLHHVAASEVSLLIFPNLQRN